MLSSREILWACLFFLMLSLKTKISVILVRATCTCTQKNSYMCLGCGKSAYSAYAFNRASLNCSCWHSLLRDPNKSDMMFSTKPMSM